ncbi:MAG: hypothetical protein KBG84_06940 [Planctomycetes bacterium]|nr:hypothetical protein [Planctomycetota bacterium]
MPSLTGHSRWHSRTAFLCTTLMVLITVGGPFHVTQGLLTHGALFLPVTLLLLYVLGTPLTRVALSAGQLDLPLAARDAVTTMQYLLRLVLAGAMFYTAIRAAGWIFSVRMIEHAPNVLDYQTVELTPSSAQWHGLFTNAFFAGAVCVLGFSLVLALAARKARLTGMAWLSGPLLGLFLGLFLLGVFVAYSMPGAGALAAVSAPLRPWALLAPEFWVDAGRIALLLLGAQSGLLVAAGGGLPARAEVGREARVLVCGLGLVLVISALAGLLLLCGLCVEQGLVPQALHAKPDLLLLDLVPALGERLFVSWPPEWRPSAQRVTAAWCFVVALCGSFGATSLLICRNPLPEDWPSRTTKLGVLAALCVAVALALTWWQGVNPLPALLASLPALLGWMRLTFARRAGTGLRVAKAAFEARTPALEKMHFMLAFMVARPLLLVLVVLAAFTQREGGLVLAGVALGFGLMWLGSLNAEPVRKTTMRLPKVALVCLVLCAVLGAAPLPNSLDARHAAIMAEPVAENRRAMRERFELDVQLEFAKQARAHVTFDAIAAREEIRRRHVQFVAKPSDETAGQVQDGLATLLLLSEGEGMESQQLEHAVLAPSTRDAQQLLGLCEGAHVRDVPEMRNLMASIHQRLRRPRTSAALQHAGEDTSDWLAPLAADMRDAWGAWGPEARIIRRELVRASTQERSLLFPRAGAGVTYLLCFAVSALMLALSLLLARGTART